jgi:THO complex subunit 4
MVAPVTVAPVPPRRMRQKKGPKRLKKRVEGHTQPASKEDLDKEMDEYRAEAEAILS